MFPLVTHHCHRRIASIIAIVCSLSAQLCCVSTAEEASTPAEAIAAAASVAVPPGVENGVVKIFSTVRYPDLFRPWSKQPPQEITGSGVVIEGKRILTNAHVVMYASQVQVQANQSGQKIFAKVVAIAPGVDLAVLEMEDDSFFETHPPIPRGSALPEIKDAVLVYGYPMGGTSLSITKGIVSRIEFTQYNFPVFGLRIQVDAAINPGNSGGPAIADERMIGLAFSVLGGAQNIGYIIPNEEIELFLKDIADGNYDGKPAFFDEWQKLQNSSLRGWLKLDRKTEGIALRTLNREAPDYPLKTRDVITKIGGIPIDDEGMVKIGSNLRVRFEYEVQRTVHNGSVTLTVLRNQKELTLEVPVSPDRPMLLYDLKGTYPSYFVYGPLVFSHVSMQFALSLNRESVQAVDNLVMMGTPMVSRRYDPPAFPGEELVAIASPFFPNKIAQGYWSPVGWVLKAVDGIPIKNLSHLIEVLRDGSSQYVTFEFVGRGVETIAFVRSEALAAMDDILSDNGLRAQGSPDTLAVWNAKNKK